jgi:hypothetical protein
VGASGSLAATPGSAGSMVGTSGSVSVFTRFSFLLLTTPPSGRGLRAYNDTGYDLIP